jgi:hypothetical protein
MKDVIDSLTPMNAPTPLWMRMLGWVFSALPVVMMGAGGVFALAKPEMMLDGLAKQGWPARVATPLAITEIVCALLYAIPKTAVLGAILLTAYLGGAVASHVRAEEPVMMIPAIVFGIFTWLGLLLRDARVRALLPLRRL